MNKKKKFLIEFFRGAKFMERLERDMEQRRRATHTRGYARAYTRVPDWDATNDSQAPLQLVLTHHHCVSSVPHRAAKKVLEVKPKPGRSAEQRAEKLLLKEARLFFTGRLGWGGEADPEWAAVMEVADAPEHLAQLIERADVRVTCARACVCRGWPWLALFRVASLRVSSASRLAAAKHPVFSPARPQPLHILGSAPIHPPSTPL